MWNESILMIKTPELKISTSLGVNFSYVMANYTKNESLFRTSGEFMSLYELLYFYQFSNSSKSIVNIS